MNKPEKETPEYFEFMQTYIDEIESVLPVKIHGFTNWTFAFYFLDVDGFKYQDLNYAHIDVFENLKSLLK